MTAGRRRLEGRWREPQLLGPPVLVTRAQRRAGVPGLGARTGGNFGEVAVWSGALCGVELGTPWTNLALTVLPAPECWKVSLRQIFIVSVERITWPKK